MNASRIRSSLVAFLLLAVPLAFRTTPALAQGAQPRITGSATYRERIALPAGAAFEASLEDVTAADAPARRIARTRQIRPGQVPISFEIRYDPRRIVGGRNYGVRASIYVDGHLRYTSDRAYPVLTRGHGSNVAIVMRRVTAEESEEPREDSEEAEDSDEPGDPLGTLPATFTGMLPCSDCAGIRIELTLLQGGAFMRRTTYLREDHDASYYQLGKWLLSRDRRNLTLRGERQGDARWTIENGETLRSLDSGGTAVDSDEPHELKRTDDAGPLAPRLRLEGMFRYMADAARFRDCASGLQWPVEMSDDYPALEREYGRRRVRPGSELMVSLHGRIEERPKMDGEGTEPTLVVERFLAAMPGRRCDDDRRNGEGQGRTGLENNRWRPTRIGTRTVTLSAREREPWIHFDSREKRITGSGGCNRIGGSYVAGGTTLRFGPIIATKMACPSMDLETAFLRALDQTRRYRVSGRFLDLMDANGRLLARLEERNL